MPGGVEDSAGRDDSAQSFALAFSRLNVAKLGGHTSPHKPRMLLAPIDLAGPATSGRTSSATSLRGSSATRSNSQLCAPSPARSVTYVSA